MENIGMDGPSSSTVEVRLFATFREYLPPGSNTFSCTKELTNCTTVADVIADLRLPREIPKIILINGKHSNEQQLLYNGDVLSIFPPIAGG
jgi:sulfur-carrier protein